MTPCAQRFSFCSVFCLRCPPLLRELLPRGRISALTETITRATPHWLFCANPFLSPATGLARLPVKIPIPGPASASFSVRKDLVLRCCSRGQLQVDCVTTVHSQADPRRYANRSCGRAPRRFPSRLHHFSGR